MQGHESTHYPFLTTEELPGFFKALTGYSGSELMAIQPKNEEKVINEEIKKKPAYIVDYENRFKSRLSEYFKINKHKQKYFDRKLNIKIWIAFSLVLNQLWLLSLTEGRLCVIVMFTQYSRLHFQKR